ncbi:MAG TPA: L,D-transpeptidase family protein [Panacibacter sp.]|nr:L,D-transpeptidase family protein [Panacibacter sp.]HNP45549.1 L,D-transpeptidase family protein [Panacibacter sp.]
MKPFVTLAIFFALFIVSITTVSCNGKGQKTDNIKKDTIPAAAADDMAIPGSFSTQSAIIFDSNKLTTFFQKYPAFNNYKQNIDSFYENRKFAFAWFDSKGIIEQAGNLLNRMVNINQEGLPDSIFYKAEFTDMISNDGLDSANKPAVYTELMLTAQYFYYADKVWQGFNDKTLTSIDWFLPRKKVSYTQMLDSLIGGKDVLSAAPVFIQYNRLKDYLRKFRNIQASGGFPQVKADKKSYKKGDSSEVLKTIRSILVQTGDLSTNDNSTLYDDELEQGVKSFQSRFGIATDGVIGQSFIKEINTPVEKRIEQIIVNMERSRWVPVSLTKNYVVINIPEFKLHVFENDSLAWSMNVVVGQPAHKTVIFNGDIKYIVFSPYWNVPTSIKNNEILPAIRRNKNYLASHNMEYYDGGNIRQKPGPNNSLGLVKFLFPNSHSIYLHDTPSKSLFGESSRAFSHGCIRLSEPQKFAEYLLRNDSAWTKDKIVTAMNAGKEKYVTLKTPLPVFIAYFTTWVDGSGKINFRNDVYGRDSRISEMLVSKK